MTETLELKKPTKHVVRNHVVHAESDWANGNSPVGLMVAVNLYTQGRETPSHIVHLASETCEYC